MYEFYNFYGDKNPGVEPTDNLGIAVKIADSFELIIHDTETGMDIYDPFLDEPWKKEINYES